MKEDQLKQILLFFFFVTLNEQRSKELAQDAWFWCLEKKKRNSELSAKHIVLLSLQRSWKDLQHESRKGVSSFSADSGWLLMPNLRLEPWKEFQKMASSDELFITVLAQILGFSNEVISQTLGISSGTVRYRLAKTARRIGKSVNLYGSVVS